MKYAWITQHRDSFPVALMCRVLRVSRSSYYASLHRPTAPRNERTAKIRESARQVRQEKQGIYGAAQIAEKMTRRDDLKSAYVSVFKYIETLYNRERIDEMLGYTNPDKYEAGNTPAVAA